MALTAIVTKKSVNKTLDGRYNISFNLNLKNDTVEALNLDYSCRYKIGENVSSKLALIIADMQKAINDYKAQKVVFNSTVLDSAVTTIQNGLIL